ncbi:hypothetical protein HPB49_015499 [Dermacentor silvarum]|uniref:Uncharacterized protein n=1 Tax=Dermacentor silvarum TaxID=543639 RepID=A0ACB8D5U6_DERSI|nr:hypothetical protein HPB49_015499 [Dermacentor silvarum]
METEVEGELLTPKEFSKDSGWQTVAVRRSGAKSAPIERVGGISTGAKPNDNLSAKGRRDRGRAKSMIIQGRRMPPLPKEDAKIIVRPMGGLNISKVGPIVVTEAIWNPVGIDPAKRDSDTMCPNFQQHIMVVSTPWRENVARYVRVECIAVGVKASAPTAIEVPVRVSDSAGASKRRAVPSKEESVSQTNEIKGMLATLTTSVQQLHQGLALVQVALRGPKRGLGALADHINALERLVIPDRRPLPPATQLRIGVARGLLANNIEIEEEGVDIAPENVTEGNGWKTPGLAEGPARLRPRPRRQKYTRHKAAEPRIRADNPGTSNNEVCAPERCRNYSRKTSRSSSDPGVAST